MFFFTPLQAEKFLPHAYNSFAGEFSQTRHAKWPEFDLLSKDSYEDKKDNSNIKILDIGCGNARLRNFLAEKKFSGEYYGRDIAKNFLEEAKKNIDASAQKKSFFSVGGFLDLKNDFSANTFDEVWAVASFHHLSQDADRKKALQDIFDILKPNGEMVITVWNVWEQKKYSTQRKKAFWRSVYNPFFSARDFLIPWGKQKIPRYYYSFSKEYLTKLLQEAGFEISNIFYSDKKRNLCVRAKKRSKKLQKFLVQDIPFYKTSEEEVLEELSKDSEVSPEKIQKIYTPNPEMIVECKKNEKFKKVLQNADLSLADGNGILWASGLPHIEGKFFFWKFFMISFSLFRYAFFRKNYPKKISFPICGSDIFQKFLEKTKKSSKIKIFLLGGEEGSAKFVQKKYSQVVGVFDGFVNEKTKPEVLKQIEKSQANFLFVALGAPKQEFFIAENENFLAKNTHITKAMGVGGSFDFISGHQTRAPKFFRKLGLEWVFRLIKHPERAGRIWNATGKFIGVMSRDTSR
jgi:N-acetylglucosaminyldiphosphoundecaprenol N-acetyl-beta-D-mannosaminyltransferase